MRVLGTHRQPRGLRPARRRVRAGRARRARGPEVGRRGSDGRFGAAGRGATGARQPSGFAARPEDTDPARSGAGSRPHLCVHRPRDDYAAADAWVTLLRRSHAISASEPPNISTQPHCAGVNPSQRTSAFFRSVLRRKSRPKRAGA